MHGHKMNANKNLKTNFFEYEPYENEPKIRGNYNIAPELEDVLLDYSRYLKKRVWRQMKRVRRQYTAPLREHDYVEVRVKKINPAPRNLAHI